MTTTNGVSEIESGTSKARSDQSSMPELQFVNDWSELERAVETLGWVNVQKEDGTWELDDHPINVIHTYVPRLLTQYASLLETSFALTEGWEQYAALNPPQGLYLPDHR